MEILSVKNLSFKYPQGEKYTLNNLSFAVKRGEFITVCGKSGCGKTTLLRHFKPPLTPHGERSGEISFCEKHIEEMDLRMQCSKIGFVQQRPENQIVTDKVWHELAFGLENLGFKTAEIRTRVSEMASFFGIQNWFYKDTASLSGGQKQLLNLASVMVMQPDILILDEPTAQLDPITAVNFLETVAKINRELGTTVIVTEHRLEEVFPMSDRIIIMEKGKIVADGKPCEMGAVTKESLMFWALPTAMRVFSEKAGEKCPVTVREGREFLEKTELKANVIPIEKTLHNPAIIELRDVWFRYEKNGPDVLKGLDLKIPKGEIFAILGGNGTGKTTALSTMAGLLKPFRGKVLYNGKNIFKNRDAKVICATLPQDPQTLFSQKTAMAELSEMCSNTEEVLKMAEKCSITHILKSHPYDLSGGEQQRLALAKILLLKPKILFLDEPTKAMDCHFKQEFATILKKLKSEGVTIVAVSHDIEFFAKVSDSCAMFFDGVITSTGSPREFFTANSFYTTAAARMSRGIIENALFAEDIKEVII